MNDQELERMRTAADPRVRERALLVESAIELGPSAAAQKHGVTRRTATKWLGRYRQAGTAGLMGDSQRRERHVGIRQMVLTAPLRMPTAKGSSRAISSELGLSQSQVARIWADAALGGDMAEQLAARSQPSQMTLTGLLISSDYSVLVMRPSPSLEAEAPAVPASEQTRRRLRTVLAADLVREGVTELREQDAVGEFWDAVLADHGPGSDLLVAVSAAAPVPEGVDEPTACRRRDQWQSVLPYLAEFRESAIGEAARELETKLRRWHQSSHEAFLWVAPRTRGGPTMAGVSPRPATRSAIPERAIADQILATIRHGIGEGSLAGGDRVTERYLAERLRTTRGAIRAALPLLEQEGLVTVVTGRGAVIPIPTAADVIETYAARRALGALMVRAAVRWLPDGRAAVGRVLAELDACRDSDDVERANQLDQTFQRALSDASGLKRIGPILEQLSDQVLMFIAIIGIRYAFPVDLIAIRDRELFEAIDRGDVESAVEIWRIKMDESVKYMLEQLRGVRAFAP